MATAGHVAAQGSESASPWITIPAEFVGAMTRSPAQYLDTATGAIMNADTGTLAGVKRLQDLWDKKFGQSEMDTAGARMKAIADDPYAAYLALESPAVDTNGLRTTSLSPSQVIDDAGIFVAERDIALRDPIFSAQLDDSMDMALNSIANEMETLLNPSTGVYDFKALEDLMPKIKDDLLAGVDDQVRIARENMETMLKIYDGDVTAMAKEFDQEFNIVYGSIKAQENTLWEPITASNFQIDTTTFKQSIADIVASANRETNIPAEKFAEFLGAGLLRTDSGWKQVPLTMKGDKKALQGMGKIVWPDVPMGNMQSPQVMKQVRTTLNEMVRDPNVNIHKDSAVKAQSAAVQALTDGASTVPLQFRNQYETATAYSKKVHDTFTRSKITSKVKDAVPEKRLEVATGGKGAKETDMNLVTREFGDMYSMDVGSGGREAQSKMLKSAENMLMTKFANQVDSSDLASFDLFIAQHKTWFERFPAAGRAVKEARKQAKIGGAKVKDMDTAQTAANLDIFTTMTGRNPDQIMDTILKASQPTVQARRFKVMLSKNPDALGVFQDAIARRIMGQSLRNIESQIVGGGKVDVVDPAALKKISDQLAPLTSVFKGKEMKGLEMLQARMKVLERQLSIKGRSSAVEEESTFTSGAMKMAARLGGIKAVSTVFGSSSIVLAGTASNLATKGLEALSMGATSKIMAEAYRNPELMKILLSRNVTPTQLSALQDGSYQTGRTLYKALTGQLTEEE
jgi:hypothetical protein